MLRDELANLKMLIRSYVTAVKKNTRVRHDRLARAAFAITGRPTPRSAAFRQTDLSLDFAKLIDVVSYATAHRRACTHGGTEIILTRRRGHTSGSGS